MRTLFYDDVYHFLYSSKMFQQLMEEEQQAFLQQFADDAQFRTALAIAADFQTRIGKIAAVVTEGEATYEPFRQKRDVIAPLIIGLDTSRAIGSFEIQAQGLMFPLLELCAIQQRDCIVLTEDERFLFPHGSLLPTAVKGVQHIKVKEHTNMAVLYKQALQLFDQYEAKRGGEFLLITANTFEPSAILEEVIHELQLRRIELSAIVLDEKQFEASSLLFLDKVFFPNA
ncbi:hypothetical protein AAGS61_11590 [Lysinibacillus sp. KU-BSD001]|uniref:hypothetical protein n=1 Tax=Lysinibacillus sp. KU-BSD001 TaxID=3141328 RepID=UPI0036F14F03